MSRELYELYDIIEKRGIGVTALKRWCPHKPTTKQSRFLDLDCYEAFFGGAAGGGKSDALLMGALQYVDIPEYSALILRKSYTDLALAGAVMDRAYGWLGGTAAHWNGTDKTWTFPSGARLTFGYLDTDKDKYRYQSAEFQYIAFDELTQFPESSYRYLMSRVRRTSGSKVPLRVRSASNPGGVGHQWVFDRFVADSSDSNRVFVPSLLGDNPYIDAEEYRKSLSQLDETTRRQLELGHWVQDTQGLVYKYSVSRNSVERLPEGKWRYVLGVDFGASQIEATTAFATWAFNSQETEKVYLVECTRHAGMIVSTIAEQIQALMEVYDYEKMVADQGALGVGYIEELKRRHNLPVHPSKKANKLGFRKLFNGDLERGNVVICRAGCSDWIDEAEHLMWDKTGMRSDGGYADHGTDAALYAWREARHFMYVEKEPLPEKGTRAYNKKVEQKYLEKLTQRVKDRQNDIFSGIFQ